MNGFVGNHLYSVMAVGTLALFAGSFLLRKTKYRYAPQVAGMLVAVVFLAGSLIWGGVADLFLAVVVGIPVALSALAVKLLVR